MKKILAGFLSAAMIMSSMVSYAAADRTAQSTELHNLLSQCEVNNYAVDYEKAAIEIFDWYKDLEATDEAEGKLSSAQISYNANALTEIYTETKSKLNKYISQGRSDYEEIAFPSSGIRNIKNNTFIDGSGKPLQSVGFGHSTNVFEDADLLKKLGSNNTQTEIGPNMVARQSDITLWKILKNNGCDATAALVADGGDHFVRISNNVNESQQANTYLLLSQAIPVERDATYTISFKAKANATTTLRVMPNGFGSGHQDFSIGTTEATYTLNPFTADNYYAQLSFISRTASVIDIDDVVAVKAGDSKNAVRNGDFEKEGKYYFDETDLLTKLSDISTISAKGYSVDLLLSPHYMPSFMKTLYPDMVLESASGFLTYNVNHSMAKQFISDYLDFIMPFVANCNGIKSVCLSNEPNFNSTRVAEFYAPLFREWLQNKYGTISSLNSEYGTSYSSFDAVTVTNSLPKGNAFTYDYSEFNEDIFTEWHQMMAEKVKEYAPSLPIHAKVQDYLYFYDRYENNKIYSGTNIEKLSQFFDIAGNDAVIDIDDSKPQQGNRSKSITDTMLWYDFLSSTTNKPVYNSENHMMNDGENGNTDAWVQNVRYAIMNGAVHGMNATTIWNWQRNDDYLFKYNPKAVYEASKSFLDLTRLTYKFSAFQTAAKDVAFFYSKASRVLSIPASGTANVYTDTLESDYRAVSALGHKTGFVTETDPAKVNDYQTLILTDVRYIPEGSINTIASFMKNGGKVIIHGSNETALKYNEHGKETISSNRTYILNNAKYVTEGTTSAYSNAFVSLGLSTSPFTENGTIATDLDVKKANVNGNELIYVTNLTNTTKTVVKAGKYQDLISGEVYQNTITLSPYEPVMLSVYGLDYNDDEGDNDQFDENQNDTIEFDAEITDTKITFNLDYILQNRGKVRAIIFAKDASNNVLDYAYCERISQKGENCSLEGEIEVNNAEKVELFMFNAYNSYLLHKRTVR